MTVQGLPTFLTSGSHTAGAVRRQVQSQAGDYAGVIDLDDLKIVPAASPNTTVFASGGKAFVKGSTAAASQGFYHVDNQGLSSAITFAAFPAGSFRKDIVVARVRDANIIGGSVAATAAFTIESVSGTNGSNTPPATPADSLLLAEISIPASTGTLGAGAILDKRVLSRPWNMPWGVMGAAKITSNQSTYTLVDTPGLSVGPITYVAHRKLKITAHGQIMSSLAEGCVIVINDGSGQIHGGNVYSPTNVWASYWTSIHTVEDTVAGANTYKVRHGPSFSSSGQILVVAAATSPCVLIVEDIGPATAQP